MRKFILTTLSLLLACGTLYAKENPRVKMKTSLGEMTLELYADKAPDTVENFLFYVDRGFYDGTIFHRVIPGFMIQGGGMTRDLKQKPTAPPVKNEADQSRSNLRGTLAMARTQIVDSATAQFFINLVDNRFLDHKDNSPSGFGYCVFGKVIQGMEIADEIAKVQTGNSGMYQDVPLKPVIIYWIKRLGKK